MTNTTFKNYAHKFLLSFLTVISIAILSKVNFAQSTEPDESKFFKNGAINDTKSKKSDSSKNYYADDVVSESLTFDLDLPQTDKSDDDVDRRLMTARHNTNIFSARSITDAARSGKENRRLINSETEISVDPHKSLYLICGNEEKRSFTLRERQSPCFDSSDKSGSSDDSSDVKEGFQWRSAINQSLMFLGVQHGYAILGQAKTRRALKHGPFFRDYFDSVKSLHGWNDGGRFFTNYIAHPMQGSLTGFIYVQNDPKALKQQFGMSGDYWRKRMTAMLWTVAWSTQFEIGPISQASIGNVGLKGKQTWEDIVVTPTLGTAMLITEEAIDRFVTQRIERSTNNFYIKVFSRMLLSPTRVFANLLRFKEPWYRDRPTAH